MQADIILNFSHIVFDCKEKQLVLWLMRTVRPTPQYTLTIFVLTSFSMALTSSAALGTSEDDCTDVSKDED